MTLDILLVSLYKKRSSFYLEPEKTTMRLFLLYGTLLALLIRSSAYAEPPENEPRLETAATQPVFVPIIKSELALQHLFAHFGTRHIGIFGLVLPTLNFVEGMSPVVALGPTLETRYVSVTPLGGFIFNHLDPVGGLAGFRFSVHSATELPAAKTAHAEPDAHAHGQAPAEHHHAPHLGFTIIALFDPRRSWTETEIDAGIAPHWLVEFGIKGQIEGIMNGEMHYLVGPSFELKPINRPDQGTLTLGISYLGGVCGENPCHGPLARLAYSFGL